jgi:anti-anti-sigma regulatory factor
MTSVDRAFRWRDNDDCAPALSENQAMLPEICEELCIEKDVVAVRFPGARLSGYHLHDHESEKHVDTIMQLPKLRDARFLILDIRNCETITKRFLSTCIRLHKKLRDIGCQMVLMCTDDVAEIYVITKLDKLFHVILDETALQNLLDTTADIPIYVARQG